jgi:hypothetical protein
LSRSISARCATIAASNAELRVRTHAHTLVDCTRACCQAHQCRGRGRYAGIQQQQRQQQQQQQRRIACLPHPALAHRASSPFLASSFLLSSSCWCCSSSAW